MSGFGCLCATGAIRGATATLGRRESWGGSATRGSGTACQNRQLVGWWWHEIPEPIVVDRACAGDGVGGVVLGVVEDQVKTSC